MADKLEEIKNTVKQVQDAHDTGYESQWEGALNDYGEDLLAGTTHLLKLVEAAERYIESDIAYDTAVRHAEYLDAAAARDAREKALDRWMAAKGETT